MQGGGGKKKRGHKKKGSKVDEPQASKPIATAAQSPASGIQPAHTSSRANQCRDHNAVVLAFALASMLNGLLASSAAASAQPLCSSSACFHLIQNEPNGLFRLRLASCALVSRFQVVYNLVYSLTNGSSCFSAEQTSMISPQFWL